MEAAAVLEPDVHRMCFQQGRVARALPLFKEVVISTHCPMLPIENPALAARDVLTFLFHDAPVLAEANLPWPSLAQARVR